MLKKMLQLCLMMLLVLLMVQCSGAEPTAVPPTAAPTEPTPNSNQPAALPTWEAVLAEAKGQTVNWYMWGGQENINTWVTGYVAQTMQEKYGITVNMVPVVDTADVVNKVLAEKEAGRTDDGTVDLIWINGENFRTMRQGNLLYGPWADKLPNTQYINWQDASVNTDLGFPVDYFESPYGKAQFVMIYDSAQVPQPPTTIPALVEWIKANPGRFTYPAPPDFTGTAFMMHLCYYATGGHEQFLMTFDQATFDEKWGECWNLLNEIEPFLWREGQTYPESHAQQDDLFANGEVWFNMAYNPAEASSKIESGKFSETTRTFVFESGTLANTHYVAIPVNSPHKAAAMVLADFLLSPEAQYSKADTANWGDRPAVDVNLLPAEWQTKFNELPRGIATLSDAELAAQRLPELQASWRVAAEKAWETLVLEQ